jgi:PBP1b-binding outer membrane lipoprotein LpoB
VKKFIYIVIFIAIVCFSGCATTGGAVGVSPSEQSTGGKLSEADLQRMGITHGGYGNSN